MHLCANTHVLEYGDTGTVHPHICANFIFKINLVSDAAVAFFERKRLCYTHPVCSDFNLKFEMQMMQTLRLTKLPLSSVSWLTPLIKMDYSC